MITNKQIKATFDELSALERNARKNSRTAIFAKKVRAILTSAYETIFDASWKPTGEYKIRSPAFVPKANKIIELGLAAVIFGEGRDLL
jgi:phage gpG-like protein